MTEKQLYDRLEKALGDVGLPFGVLNARGEQLYPHDGITFPLPPAGDVQTDEILRYEGALYLRLKRSPPVYVALGDGLPGAEYALRLAAALVQALLKGEKEEVTREELFRRVLMEGLSGTELETLAAEQGVELKKERCVLLFQSDGNAQAIVRALAELFEGTGDVVIDLGGNAVALIREMEHVAFRELPEFVMAVADTTREETGVGFSAGIGEPKPSMVLLSESLKEARNALDIGKVYQPAGLVFVYRQQLLERFLQEIPASTAKRYYEMLFNRRNQRIFNEEMINTIDTFFECHLNVSESARRLYIHRNTLVYRLDKVQKATGLDLRSLDDAITFRMMRMLGKREEIK